MAWDDVKKAKAVEMYLAANPTAETSVQIVKDVAEELGETPNGVRMIISKAGKYIKAEAATSTAANKTEKSATPKVGKADKISALSTAIAAAGLTPDTDILDKLTGKAADYFLSVVKALADKSE